MSLQPNQWVSETICVVTTKRIKTFPMREVPGSMMEYLSRGQWNQALIKYFGIPESAHFGETPRRFTIHQLKVEPVNYPPLHVDAELLQPIYSTVPTTDSSGKVSTQLMFDSNLVASISLRGNVKSSRGQSSEIELRCYLGDEDKESLEQGRWAQIIQKTMGSYMTIGEIPLEPMSQRPEIIPIKIPAPKKPVKTIDI